ncbi:MAG: Methyltransferase protein [Mycobacterium sp.]|jgi:SAM-dependent methyltransferase|nr:Methyltransferase protein [Mycobacterium sp.]
MTDVEGDTGLQSDVLEDLRTAVNYRRWLCSLGVPFFGDDVLEIGSGLGYYAADWADMGVRITASEADPARLAQLTETFAGDPRVRVRELAVPIEEEADYSTVVAYNVLEHIPDDVAALRAFRGLLRPGGAVVLVVPAFPGAMSRFDRAIGHQRRYTRAALSSALGQAGLHVERCHYVNAPGLLAWYVGMRLLGGRPKEGPLLTVWDRAVVPVERRIERYVRMPFGQSVFAVARR